MTNWWFHSSTSGDVFSIVDENVETEKNKTATPKKCIDAFFYFYQEDIEKANFLGTIRITQCDYETLSSEIKFDYMVHGMILFFLNMIV